MNESPNPDDQPPIEDPPPASDPEPNPNFPKPLQGKLDLKVTPLDEEEHIKEGIEVEER